MTAGRSLNEPMTLDEVTSADIHALHGYWERIRGGRAFPAKRDIDPAAIRSILPYLMISEIHRDPLRIRYRLVGTEQVRFAGQDFTNRWLDELDWGDGVRRIEQRYRLLLEVRKPIFRRADMTWIDNRTRVFESGLFPLSEDGANISHGLAIEDFRHIDRSRWRR